ncbi:MAG: hypothetical protein Q4G47_05165, partial [Lachnospiraceae bacterium]|nr:hypothetical protein [Lachnospiraceae bacterium]
PAAEAAPAPATNENGEINLLAEAVSDSVAATVVQAAAPSSTYGEVALVGTAAPEYVPSAGANELVGSTGNGNDMTGAASGNLPVGTPMSGTTQAAGSNVDSLTYATYEDMVAAYKSDVAEIRAGDTHDKNIVSLYNPRIYIGDSGTEDPKWTRIVMGATEGDMPLMASMNLMIDWLNAGTDAAIEWQWDGGHVPSEILGDSFSLYVDQMYGKYVPGAIMVLKRAATPASANGTAAAPTGTDISGWVSYGNTANVSFSLADASVYRTNGASKAMPGFDSIDYGQEDYVFGSYGKDARHWDSVLTEIFEDEAATLKPLFNSNS